LSYASVPPDFIDQKEKGISNQSEGEIDENGVFHCFPHEFVMGLAYPPPHVPTYANKNPSTDSYLWNTPESSTENHPEIALVRQ
jgi:hypothetical protein